VRVDDENAMKMSPEPLPPTPPTFATPSGARLASRLSWWVKGVRLLRLLLLLNPVRWVLIG